MRYGVGVLLCASILACSESTGPRNNDALVIADATPIPHDFADGLLSAMWTRMQTCSGRTGTMSYNDIHFFNVPRDNFPYGTLPDTGTALGLWVGSRNQIYVARMNRLQTDSQVQRTTKHEMMHALLYPIGGHPDEWFRTGAPCGNLMADGGFEH